MAFAMAASVVLGGRTFAWCVPMQKAMARCCDAGATRPKDAAPAAIRSRCCETRVVPALPTASTESAELVVRAPALAQIVALLPYLLHVATSDERRYVPCLQRQRGAPGGVGLYDLHRAYLI